MLIKEGFDSVRPIVRFSYPIQRAFKYADGQVCMFHPEFMKTRSQDLETAYHDAGQFYWFRFEKGLSGPKRGAIIIPQEEVQDIDTPEDLKMAEYKYKVQHGAR